MKYLCIITAILVITLTSYVLPSVAQTEGSEFAVITNKESPGSNISLPALKSIFLREVREWGNGGKIIVVDLDPNANAFFQNLFGKTHSQMQTYWLNQKIKNSIDLPITKKDAESVKQFVAENKTAIGFIKSSDVDDRVKVIKIAN
jgi:ABC-type phosphate transport system substrate-binding protein